VVCLTATDTDQHFEVPEIVLDKCNANCQKCYLKIMQAKNIVILQFQVNHILMYNKLSFQEKLITVCKLSIKFYKSIICVSISKRTGKDHPLQRCAVLVSQS